MNEDTDIYPVVIVGGGPVGLFLACCLEHLGISCRVLEQRKEPITHSRSLGVHPVSLELFYKMGLASPFIQDGIKIFEGIALTEAHTLGTISFRDEPLPFNFILSIPQFKTEKILLNHLCKLNPKSLVRGAEMKRLEQYENYVSVIYQKDGSIQQLKSRFVVGCDGKNSRVRETANIQFNDQKYPDTYLMGDFEDSTSFGNDAAIYLHKDGLIESFPMPGNMRRWVVKTQQYVTNPTRTDLEKIVADRIGIDLSKNQNSMLSSFGVQKMRAKHFVKNSIILAGDAAHVVSPIGGQGMNLGWLNTWFLAHQLNKILVGNAPAKNNLQEYSSFVSKNVRKVIKRSELNMRLGRKRRFTLPRNALVWLMLNTPLQKMMAKLFTMRKLKEWPI